MFAVNSTTGVLTPLATPTVATGTSPQTLTINPAGTFAYVPNQSDNTVSIYRIGSNGILTSLGTASTGSEPVGIAINPAGTFAYVTNNAGNTVSMYAINSTTGMLTSLAPSTVAAGGAPGGITINAAGTLAYVANYGGNSISMFTIGSNGVLTASGTAVPTQNNPTILTIAPR